MESAPTAIYGSAKVPTGTVARGAGEEGAKSPRALPLWMARTEGAAGRDTPLKRPPNTLSVAKSVLAGRVYGQHVVFGRNPTEKEENPDQLRREDADRKSSRARR